MKIIEKQEHGTLVPNSVLECNVRKLIILTILENKDVIKGADVEKR